MATCWETVETGANIWQFHTKQFPSVTLSFYVIVDIIVTLYYHKRVHHFLFLKHIFYCFRNAKSDLFKEISRHGHKRSGDLFKTIRLYISD
jgi:hypothetical protein